jgi:chromosome segregation ATPase
MWILLCALGASTRIASSVSPIEKVLQLLGELEAKIIKDGEETQKLYEEFTDYCKGTAKDTQFAIKTGKSAAERFSATAEDSAAEIVELETKIGELSTKTATNSKDLAAATEIRKAEAEDYTAADAELSETIDMLRRAIAILEKEMSKTGFIQSDAISKVADALATLVSAGGVKGVSMADQDRLQAFLQGADEQPAGAPAPAAYEGQSGGIISAMEDMLEKAEAQRSDGQKAEMEAAHNFAMLKQSLEDAIKVEKKEMSEAKKQKAVAEETGATAEGELERTNKEIADDQKKLKELQQECMTKAEEHQQEQKERGEELGALAAAKKVLNEKTGGAAERTYGFVAEPSASFLQLRTRTRSRASLRQVENRVVALLQSLAQETQVRALSQLAVHIRSEMLTSADPFAKVKGMIQEMIEKLVTEAQEEAGHKAFCDKEMSETKAKMEDKQGEVDDLTTKIDKSAAKVAKLKEEIATLEQELMKIAGEQKVANEMRESEKAAWEAAKADFESGLEGVQMALQVLRDYYAEKDESSEALLQSDELASEMSLAQTTGKKSTGGASGIIGMLEVAESDFSKMLAEGSAAEDQAVKEYEAMTEDNKVTTAAKETEVKYKQKDSKETKAYIEETKSDLETSHTELSAVMEYWEKLQPQCVAKPEPYEERKKRREKEIAGLKEALTILEEESATSFLAVRRY